MGIQLLRLHMASVTLKGQCHAAFKGYISEGYMSS